jgi:hypothetical protein
MEERPEELMVDNDDASLARHVWRGVDNTSKQLYPGFTCL